MSFTITRIKIGSDRCRFKALGSKREAGMLLLSEIKGEGDELRFERLYIDSNFLGSPILIQFENGCFFVDPQSIEMRPEILTARFDPVIDCVDATRIYHDPRIVRAITDCYGNEDGKFWSIEVKKRLSAKSASRRRRVREEVKVSFSAEGFSALEDLHQRIVNETIFPKKTRTPKRLQPRDLPRPRGMKPQHGWSTRPG